MEFNIILIFIHKFNKSYSSLLIYNSILVKMAENLLNRLSYIHNKDSKYFNSELNKIENTINTIKKVNNVKEASVCISEQKSNTVEDNFYISRNKGAVCSGSEFKLSSYSSQIGKNWDLQTDSKNNYIWIFSKTFSHDEDTFLPDRSQMNQLLDFFKNPTFDKLNNLPSSTSSVRKLEDPVGGLGFEPITKHHSLIKINQTNSLNSEKGAMEMTEVYCMSLARDIKISDLNSSTDPNNIILYPNGCSGSMNTNGSITVMNILNHMNFFNSSTNIIPNWPLNSNGLTDMGLLFRGNSPDEDKGQYISQFLIQDINFSNGTFEQKYSPECDTIGSVTESGYLSIQNGENNLSNTRLSSRRITTLRDLGSLVHSDPAYGLYFNAALLASKAGLNALKNGGNGSNFLDTGGPDYLTAIGSVTRAALRTAWVTKWVNCLKIRPENAAARIVAYEKNQLPEIKTWYDYFEKDLLETVKKWNNGLTNTSNNLPFLPLIYKEGSPTHPSYPAGHATVSGACVTIIKAFIKTHENKIAITWNSVFGNPKQVDNNDNLVDVSPSGETIVGELNKLASNGALGRNIAGVHYRSDGEDGIKMGEEVAISYLKEMTGSYYPLIIQDKIEFNLQKFDGTFIKIMNGNIIKI